MSDIWAKQYINPKHSHQENLLYFSIINGEEIVIPQNNAWAVSSNCLLIKEVETDGFAQDRKLKDWEIIKLKLLGTL